MESWGQVLIGQGVPARPDPMVDLLPEAEIAAYLRDIEDVIADTASRLPDHAAFIARMRRPTGAIVTGYRSV